jgi:hypothetical protein
MRLWPFELTLSFLLVLMVVRGAIVAVEARAVPPGRLSIPAPAAPPHERPMSAELSPSSLARILAPVSVAPCSATRVREVAPETYEVEPGEPGEPDLNCLAGQARIIPEFHDGRPRGFRIFGVRAGSIYAQLGGRSADVLRRVNGLSLDSPEHALEVYSNLRRATRFEVELERGGAIIKKTIFLRPPRREPAQLSLGALEPMLAPTSLPADPTACGRHEVREVSPGTYEIEPGDLELDDVVQQVDLIPFVRDGRTIGLRLFRMQRGSLAAQLGMTVFDTLLRIDGTPVDGPEHLSQIYKRLRERTRFEVELERGREIVKKTILLVRPPHEASRYRPSTSTLAH